MATYFTSAPECYDGFGTRTLVSHAGDIVGKSVRMVDIREESLQWQKGRYDSGSYCCLTEDEWFHLAEIDLAESHVSKLSICELKVTILPPAAWTERQYQDALDCLDPALLTHAQKAIQACLAEYDLADCAVVTEWIAGGGR